MIEWMNELMNIFVKRVKCIDVWNTHKNITFKQGSRIANKNIEDKNMNFGKEIKHNKSKEWKVRTWKRKAERLRNKKILRN